jgi:ligand-binding sensor domain-containing protein/PAS domain-containing protein
MTRKFNLLFFIILASILQAKAQGEITFERISIEQGLTHTIVNNIFQDSKGFMWFCTGGGLCRYDGYNFKEYRPEPDNDNSLSSRNIYCIVEDKGGTLWIGAEIGLNRLDPKTDQITRYVYDPKNTGGISNQIINDLLIDKKGNLWLATGNGINLYNRKNDSFIHFTSKKHDSNTIPDNTINCLFEDKQGQLWAGTDSGFAKFNPQISKWVTYSPNIKDGKTISNKAVYHITEHHDGNLLIGAKNYFGILHPKNNLLETFLSKQNNLQTVNSSTNQILFDNNKKIWLATENGLCFFDVNKKSLTSYIGDSQDPYDINNFAIKKIFQDRSGIIWMATYKGGVYKYDPNKIKFNVFRHDPRNPQNSIPENNIYAIFQDKLKNIWVGTWSQGLTRIDGRTGKYSFFKTNAKSDKSIYSNSINTIAADKNGDIWAGAWSFGLEKITNNGKVEIKRYPGTPDIPNGFHAWTVTKIILSDQGDLFFTTHDFGVRKYNSNNDKFSYYPQSKDTIGIPYGSIWNVLLDKSGKLWIGSDTEGFCIYDPHTGRYENYRHRNHQPNSLICNSVRCILQASDGYYYISTAGGGIDRFDYKKKTFTHFTTNQGLCSNMVYGLLEDKKSNIWMSTERGLSRFNLKTQEFRNFDISDGIQSNEFNPNSYSIASDGRMFFGGVNGFNAFYPDSIKESQFKVPVVITNLEIFNHPVKVGEKFNGRVILENSISDTKKIILNYSDKIFTIEFAALHYAAPEKIMYKFKLEGFDENWQTTTAKRRLATYSNIPGGTYTFRVIATNCDGIWNTEGATLIIKVRPPFWKTWWFITLFLITLTSIIIYYVKWREKKLAEEKNTLESKVEARTKEVVKQKNEIERQNEEIRKRKEADKDRLWANEGFVIFADVLSKNKEDISTLTHQLIKKIIEYTEINMGGIYLFNEDNPDEIFLQLIASYAFDAEMLAKDKILNGEGLIGTCFKEANTKYINNLPENYIKIQSGLGQASMKCLLLVPLKFEEINLGVIELASFDEIPQYKIEFVEKLAQNITSTLFTARVTIETKRLLAHSQEQAEELMAQEEEMRQNIEELRSTQDEMSRLKEIEEKKSTEQIKLTEKYKKFLNTFLDIIPFEVYMKDSEGKIILANKQAADAFHSNPDKIIERSDFDFLPHDKALQNKEEEQEIMKSGATKVSESITTDGQRRIFQVTKMPFYIDFLQQQGLLVLKIEKTEFANLNDKLKEARDAFEKGKLQAE